MIERARRIAPALGHAAFQEHWSSFRPGTPDGFPLVGETQIESLLVASGHYRNGILLAPLTAELIRDAITGEPPTRETEVLSPRRFVESQ